MCVTASVRPLVFAGNGMPKKPLNMSLTGYGKNNRYIIDKET